MFGWIWFVFSGPRFRSCICINETSGRTTQRFAERAGKRVFLKWSYLALTILGSVIRNDPKLVELIWTLRLLRPKIGRIQFGGEGMWEGQVN